MKQLINAFSYSLITVFGFAFWFFMFYQPNDFWANIQTSILVFFVILTFTFAESLMKLNWFKIGKWFVLFLPYLVLRVLLGMYISIKNVCKSAKQDILENN
jgi:predicted membrane protein